MECSPLVWILIGAMAVIVLRALLAAGGKKGP